MIITRTPFRVSFAGGGTDFPSFYKEHGGSVISTSIDKYAYVLVHPCNPCFDYNFKASYSEVETVKMASEFKHPLVRHALLFMNFDKRLEINHVSDLPGRTGLGTSSSFTVGLLLALSCFRGEISSPSQLARDAIYIERECAHDPGGHQDQYAAAFGGLNRIDFSSEDVTVTPLNLTTERRQEFHSYLMLFFLGFERSSNEILRRQEKKRADNTPGLLRLKKLVDNAQGLLLSKDSFGAFGALLHEAWCLKKTFSEQISNPFVDEVYENALSAGASGGKVLGAGGNGFLMLVAEPSRHAQIEERLRKLRRLSFDFDTTGSSVILK